jgi:hypothetical protein
MDESFEIPVLYKGQDLHFTSRLLISGYTHKIEVDVNGIPVQFEPDEERNYRAIVDAEKVVPNQKIDAALLKAIAHAIESIVK